MIQFQALMIQSPLLLNGKYIHKESQATQNRILSTSLVSQYKFLSKIISLAGNLLSMQLAQNAALPH